MRPTEQTLKKLFALSRNVCAFPRCTRHIVREETVVGKVCHIKAASPGGPRYDPAQSDEERHGFDNLILLCGEHHDIVDDDIVTYPVGALTAMKAQHEAQGPLSDGEIAAAWPAFMNILHPGAIVATTVHANTNINQSGAIVADTVHADTINLSNTAGIEDVAEREARARMTLTPELARVMAHQVFALDRINVNYGCSSPYSKSSIKPNDTWPSIKPKQPTLYPTADAFANLSAGDSALLVEFYDSIKEVDDIIASYEKTPISQLPYNEWNYLMHAAEHNLEVGLRTARRFCPDREYRPRSPASGTLVSQVERVLKAASQARDVFFKSAEAHKQDAERRRHSVTPPGAPYRRR
jgi:hypothetical protein